MRETFASSLIRSAREDEFRIRLGGATGRGTSGPLGARLTKALKGAKLRASTFSAFDGVKAARSFTGDHRQRVIVKMSFQRHGPAGGGGAGKLAAHAHYLGRDGASRDGERGQFYDRGQDRAEDIGERLEAWAEDKRHFRLVLAPESGARLIGEEGDLKSFTRETMAGMERDLGVKLDWIAIDHHNTDNPHVHVIVRGVRSDGVELVIPREYVSHGLRETARDIATEMLGARSRADERLKLDREIEAQSLTGLDKAIERHLNQKREVRLQELGRGDAPGFGDALRARARELEKRGLAEEARRNVMRFREDWRERLESERPLDVRKELAKGRLYEPSMGRVEGQVIAFGPRGAEGKALIAIETKSQERLVLNVERAAIDNLEKDALVAFKPKGRGAELEIIAPRSLEKLVQERAETALDRELDRVAKGEGRHLLAHEGVDAALAKRAQWLEREGLGVSSPSGKFYFRDGALERLRAQEMDAWSQKAAREAGLAHRPLGRDVEALNAEGTWRVHSLKGLHQGRAALLERDGQAVGVRLGRGEGLKPGQEVHFKLGRELGPERVQHIEIAKVMEQKLAKSLGLGLGR